LDRTEYNLIFYEDTRGYSETYEFIELLQDKAIQGDKTSKTLINSIFRTLDHLKRNGTRDGLPDFEFFSGRKYPLCQIRVKHPTGFFRFFICIWNQDTYVILNYFAKKQNKTPKSEIERAERLMADFIERNGGKVT
jgi:phage-related protein